MKQREKIIKEIESWKKSGFDNGTEIIKLKERLKIHDIAIQEVCKEIDKMKVWAGQKGGIYIDAKELKDAIKGNDAKRGNEE